MCKENNWEESSLCHFNRANELAGTYDHENHRSRAKHDKSTLEKKMELIATLNETILCQVEEEDIEEEIADSSEFMDEIDICFTTLEDATCVEAENVVTPPTQVNS